MHAIGLKLFIASPVSKKTIYFVFDANQNQIKSIIVKAVTRMVTGCLGTIKSFHICISWLKSCFSELWKDGTLSIYLTLIKKDIVGCNVKNELVTWKCVNNRFATWLKPQETLEDIIIFIYQLYVRCPING